MTKMYVATIEKYLPPNDGNSLACLIISIIIFLMGVYVANAGYALQKIYSACDGLSLTPGWSICFNIIADTTWVPSVVCIISGALICTAGIFTFWDTFKSYPKAEAVVSIKRKIKKDELI